MNGSRSKKLRKQVYGEGSKRGDSYGILRHIKTFFKKDKEGKEKEVKYVAGQLVCTGKRAEYKKAKKAYLKQRRAISCRS